jgi:hypothetical protein
VTKMLAAAGLPAGADSCQLLAQVRWSHAGVHVLASLRMLQSDIWRKVTISMKV